MRTRDWKRSTVRRQTSSRRSQMLAMPSNDPMAMYLRKDGTSGDKFSSRYVAPLLLARSWV